MLKPQRTKAPSDPKTHWGFNETGSYFRSEIPVQNSITRFARQLVTQIREEYLSPFDVSVMIRRESYQNSFRSLEQWGERHRFWLWPLASATSPLDEFVRSLGGKHPWLTDEYSWTAMCDACEKKYGLESRLVSPKDINQLVSSIGV